MKQRKITRRSDSKPIENICKICGGPAIYSYVGVMSCASCKMFFKRNAQNRQKKLHCYYDGQCSINISNRHTCPSCRLKKCLDCGMQVEMFRASTGKKMSTSTIVKRKSSRQKFLRSDQWIFLSNLIHSFKEYNRFTTFPQYFHHQNRLPLKLRFKIASIHQTITQMDFNRLETNLDKNNASFQQTIQEILFWHSSFISHSLRCSFIKKSSSFDPTGDEILNKLILSILIFSIVDDEDHRNEYSLLVRDLPTSIRFHDHYIELTWQYISCTYSVEGAIRCFSHLNRSLLKIYPLMVNALDVLLSQNILDSLLTQTEHILLSSSST